MVGEPLWGLNRLRADALPQLLEDLCEIEAWGLQPAQCNLVKGALQNLVAAADHIQGGFLKQMVWGEFREFHTIYEQWNALEGHGEAAVENRRHALKELRRRRKRITASIRDNQLALQDEVDVQLVRNSFAAMGGLADGAPGVFVNLGRAVSRFKHRAQTHQPPLM